TVTCSASDTRGNTATGSFTVTVVDTTPPVLTLPSNISEATTSASGKVVTYTATATDAVDGSRPVACTPASGSTFPVGTTTVTCSASDTRGNTATGSFTVTVIQQFTLSVTVTGTGSVTSNPVGISCPGDCSEPYNSGTSVTLQVVVGSFQGWGGACTGNGSCTVTMDANKSVTATFGCC
ncbi:MAG: HYR domain-containing protein, partial [Nitrospinae bacterium]|nr:HYR domain-containing protein [Nitrospinota bacterium]